MTQLVKNLPAMEETQVQSLGWEYLLEKEKANHSSILAWKIPWMDSFSSKVCLLILWLQSLSTVILEPKKTNSVTVSTFSPFICNHVIGMDAMILVF